MISRIPGLKINTGEENIEKKDTQKIPVE